MLSPDSRASMAGSMQLLGAAGAVVGKVDGMSVEGVRWWWWWWGRGRTVMKMLAGLMSCGGPRGEERETVSQ